mmetsp:Transcript_26133/g.68745  ORF Transcript_26133/g.68745 Transcript_26133/m.68745 type:complete len:357 (-) Transcript_26133:41-1111(-)
MAALAAIGALTVGPDGMPCSSVASTSTLAAPKTVRLSDSMLTSLAVGKVYRDHKGSINGLDFTYDGQYLVTSGDDNNVYVYSTARASKTKHLRCEKYGVSLIRFLHNDRDAVIAASRNETDHSLKYWDLHENKYLRLFRSHTAQPTSVSAHPYADIFLSGSDDGSVVLWDLRQDKPGARINGQGRSVASFDQQGLVFAACVGQPKLHLFDTRNYAKGEFTAFDLSPHLRGDMAVSFVQFSPCGKYLLVRTSRQLILVDAFDGELICEYPVSANVSEEAGGHSAGPPVPGFSPDSQYVVSGVRGGDVCMWEATNARLVHRLEGHTAVPGHATFSPTQALLVTAAETLAWWIPAAQED